VIVAFALNPIEQGWSLEFIPVALIELDTNQVLWKVTNPLNPQIKLLKGLKPRYEVFGKAWHQIRETPPLQTHAYRHNI
jgi:hypothetical protein